MNTRVVVAFAVAVASTLPCQALGFVQPPLSAHRIDLFGGPPFQGIVASEYWPNYPVFPSSSSSGVGHPVTPDVVGGLPAGFKAHAYYYISGRQGAPTPGGPTASGTGLVGMPGTSAYLSGAASGLSLYLQVTGGDPSKTWNLGEDRHGIEWFATPSSSVENRLYQANPADVAWGLAYNGTQILSFGYSPFFQTIDYASSSTFGDDTISGYSNPVSASKIGGLASFESGLADALLSDIANNGGLVQLNALTSQAAIRQDLIAGGYVYGIFQFNGAIQAVSSVPDAGSYTVALGILAIALFGLSRRFA